MQDESVTPVHSDIEPVLSGYSKTVEMKIPDSNTDTQETDAVDLPDGADIVDNEREHCRYEECPEPQAENDPPISQVENSIDTEIDCKSSLVDSSKNGLTGSKNIGGSKIRRSLKKSLRGRWKKTQLTVPCPKNMNASTPTSKQDDAGVPDPTTPAPLSVSEIVASLENASYRGSTSKASPGEDDKSVSMLSPHSQDSRTAKIPEKKKVRLFQTGVTRWKVAKLLGAQKHRNAESLARNADVPGKTSSNMEYRTVLAVSDESLNEEEHAAIGDGPHLTPIVENADSDGKGESAGPHEQDPSFESASMDPGNQIITSPTGGTEETGFESTLSILDDHSQDQKTKAVPAKKHRSERTHESGQSAEVSYYRGTFDDDLSNMFMPQPVTGETSKWFW